MGALGVWMLGAAWGVVAAAPIARYAARHDARIRVATLGVGAASPPRASGRRRIATFVHARAGIVGVRVLTSMWSRRTARRADVALRRDLPVAIDLLGVAVGAGCTPYLALEVAARWAPPAIASACSDVIRSCSLGLDFAAALDARAQATPLLRPVADALLASDRLGVPVGPVLARLAEEDRRALRRAAEAQARRVPVRLLFPLVFLVLPAFVLLTVVPGVAAGLRQL